MATVIVCEKCGKQSAKEKDFKHIRAHELDSPTAYRNRTVAYMDVCNECYSKIFNQGAESNA